MPWLNKRWASFFICSTVVVFVLVCLVGWANDLEAKKLENKFGPFFFSFLFPNHDLHWHPFCKDSYGTDPNSDNFPFTNWTNAIDNEVLVNTVTVNSFDPNSKAGPTVSTIKQIYIQFWYLMTSDFMNIVWRWDFLLDVQPDLSGQCRVYTCPQ